jgi:ketosteroid isomerase-like protein
MSRENVEIVRAFYQAWNAVDMDAVRECFDPDAIIVRSLEGWPEPGPFVGREAIIRQFELNREAWEADAMEPTDVIDVADRVVLRLVWRGVGRGPDSNLEFTVIVTMRKGKIFLLELFWNHAEALEALGLSEQDAHADS